MKAQSSLLPMLALTLALVLGAPAGARAQLVVDAKPRPAEGRGRQIVLDKLERIRFESVAYDGLPLSEVVRSLRDETKKRDPDKKGVNFMINPNVAPGAAPTAGAVDPATGQPVAAPAASESVDVNSIAVRIIPPLNDIRLVDVLDAIVKVADHPIKYTIEDYGVVFSAAGAEPVRPPQVVFAFEGGTPNDFLEAVQNQFKVDWKSVADVPRLMADVRIPRLRIGPESMASSAGAGGGGLTWPGPGVPGAIPGARPGGEVNPLWTLVSLYNRLGEQRPELGRLVVEGDLAKPSVVMFVPDKNAANSQPEFKVKAFSIKEIRRPEWRRLVETIKVANDEAMARSQNTRDAQLVRGSVRLHEDTSLLVANGTPAYVDMVESMVAAFRESQRVGEPKPQPPEKQAAEK